MSAPPTSSNTSPLFNFSGNDRMVYMGALSIPGSTYNAGFTYTVAGQNAGHRTRMPLGEGIGRFGNKDWLFSTRASTYSTNGTAIMLVND